MTDLEIARRLETLKTERAKLEQQTAIRLAEIKTERAALIEIMQRRTAGLDESRLKIAESVIYVRGKHEREGGCIEKAISQLANNDPILKTVAIAVKDYAQFSGQSCDCEYGYGPKYGYHVFETGLVREVRTRDLTEDERDAAIYYLVHLKQITAVNERDSLLERVRVLEEALQQLATNDLNDSNCASVDIAARRVRNIARAALPAKGE